MNSFYIHPADLSPLPCFLFFLSFFFFFFGKKSSLKIKLPGLVFSMISHSDHRFLVSPDWLLVFTMLCLQMYSSVLEPHRDHGCTQWVCVCVCVCVVRVGGWERILGPFEKRNKADAGPFLAVCFSWQRKVRETLLFSNSSQHFGLTNEWGNNMLMNFYL